jgi:hypothetical protein
MQIKRRWRLAAACLALVSNVQAAPAGWRLGLSGFGPLKVGMSFAQVRKIAPRLVKRRLPICAPAPAATRWPCPGIPASR